MILGLLLCVARLQEPAFLPAAWLERQGFQRMRLTRDSKIRVNYRNLERLLQFDLSVCPYDRRSAKKFSFNEGLFGPDGVSLAITSYRSGLSNGMPLGTDVLIHSEPKGTIMSMAFRTEWVYGYLVVSGKPDWFNRSASEIPAEVFAEELARQVLARVEARRLTHAGRKTLGATEVSTSGTPETELVDLAGWAKARGWALKIDDCLAILTKDERKLRVPLGALAVEVDGKWKDLPEVVMLQNDRWWVPLDALEAALKESQ